MSSLTLPRAKTFSRLKPQALSAPGLDLGLSLGSSQIAVVLGEKVETEPARVAIDHKARVIALGQKALEMEGRESRGVRVIQPFAEGVVTDLDWARKLLAHSLRNVPRARLGQARAVVALQSDLSAGERQALLDVLRASGIRRVHALDEALVAAVGADCPTLEPKGSLVVHLGAGSTQVTVASLGSVVVSRTLRVGGDHMNRLIQEYVRREHMVLLDEHGAEELKRELGCAIPLEPELRLEVPGRELPQGKPVLVELGSHEIGRVLEPLVAAIVAEVRLVVAQISPELLRDIVRGGIVLTGGGAHLQGLERRLRQEIRVPVERAQEPQHAVGRGLTRIMTDAGLRRALLRERHETPVRVTEKPRRIKGWVAALLVLALLSALTLFNFDRVRRMLPTPVDNAIARLLTPALAAANGPGRTDASTRAALVERDRQVAELASENQRLWSLVGRPGQKASARPLVARVVGRDPRGWLASVSLDVGSQAGVRKGMVVTSLNGNLVGRVENVDATSSRVRLFTDKGMAVAATVGAKSAGMVAGSGKRTVEMRYVDPDARLKAGEAVTTSGQDGLYPAGLKVGTMKRALPRTDESFQTLELDPATRFDILREVTLLR